MTTLLYSLLAVTTNGAKDASTMPFSCITILTCILLGIGGAALFIANRNKRNRNNSNNS